jgi:hypothetical protein
MSCLQTVGKNSTEIEWKLLIPSRIDNKMLMKFNTYLKPCRGEVLENFLNTPNLPLRAPQKCRSKLGNRASFIINSNRHWESARRLEENQPLNSNGEKQPWKDVDAGKINNNIPDRNNGQPKKNRNSLNILFRTYVWPLTTKLTEEFTGRIVSANNGGAQMGVKLIKGI